MIEKNKKESREREGNDGEINRVWSAWLCPSFVSALRGEGGPLAEAGRLLWPSARPHTVPRCPGKAPVCEGQGVEGDRWIDPNVRAPPKHFSRPRGAHCACPPAKPLDTSGPHSLARTRSPWHGAAAVCGLTRAGAHYTDPANIQRLHHWLYGTISQMTALNYGWLLATRDTRKSHIIVNKTCALMYCFVAM